MTRIIILFIFLNNIVIINSFCEESSQSAINLKATYSISIEESVSGASLYIAEIEIFLENNGNKEERVLAFSRNVRIYQTDCGHIFDAGLAKRKDGKIIKPSENAFNPVRLKPGEVAKLPVVHVVLNKNPNSLGEFEIIYSISRDLGYALCVVWGKYRCVPIRVDPSE